MIEKETWEVIVAYYKKFYGKTLTLRDKVKLEQSSEVLNFGEGCFISIGPNFDLFINEKNQGGKWKIRSTINTFLKNKIKQFGYARIGIHEMNKKSLRLANFFKFQEKFRKGSWIFLEVN